MKKSNWKKLGSVQLSLILFLWLTLLAACSPKVSAELKEERQRAVDTDTSTQVVDQRQLSECRKFSDLSEKKADKALEAYVIYRDFFKLNQYDQALPHWRKVYREAPAADGKRYVVFTDGVYMLEYLREQTDDPELEKRYVDSILTLYDSAIDCYPSYEGYLAGRKGFDIYYKYSDRMSPSKQLALFRQSFEMQGDDVPDFIMNPMTSLLVKNFRNGRIDTAAAAQLALEIYETIVEKTEEMPSNERWRVVKEYSLSQLEQLETVDGFFDCDFYLEKYVFSREKERVYQCDQILLTYSKLRNANCPENHETLQALETYMRDSCRIVPGGASGLAKEAYDEMRNGNYQLALDKFEEAMEYAESDEKRANYALMRAKIAYNYLKNFPQARKYAKEAAGYKKNWGAPYILIGKLYASSGPLCGPGRGWDSQVVTWPAIDKWEYAKKIDPSSAAEANRLIAKYWEFMPSKEDIFSRLIDEGDDFFVDCWIQENTTVRVSGGN